MTIPKDKILDLLRDRGNDDAKIRQADNERPDPVDPEQHRDLLEKLGIDPQELIAGLGDRLDLQPGGAPAATRTGDGGPGRECGTAAPSATAEGRRRPAQ